MDWLDTEENALRVKYPGKGRRADYENSRSNAIELHCLACCGGSGSVAKACTSYTCALYPYYPGRADRPDGSVPSREWYEARKAEAREANADAIEAMREAE